MANGTILQIGDFQFSVSTATYNSLQTTVGSKIGAVPRLKNIPMTQKTGSQSPSKSISGTVSPYYFGAGLKPIEDLKALTDSEEPLSMTSGRGEVLGRWWVSNVSVTGTKHLDDGTPMVQEFSLELIRYD